MLVLVARATSHRAPGVPAILEEPPEAVHPAELAVLWGIFRRSSPLLASMIDWRTQRALYQTELLHLAQSGVVELQAQGSVTEPTDLTVRLVGSPSPVDAGFVRFLFDGAGPEARPLRAVRASGRTGLLSSWAWQVRSRVLAAVVATQTAGAGDVRSVSGLASLTFRLIPLGRLGRGWPRWAAWVVSGAGALASAANGLPGGWVALPPIACILAGFVAVRLMPYRPPRAFRERLGRWASFRRFLVSYSELEDAPAAAVVIWERYLVYASALQAADDVEDQLGGLVSPVALVAPWLGAPGGPGGLAWFSALSAAAPVPVTTRRAPTIVP